MSEKETAGAATPANNENYLSAIDPTTVHHLRNISHAVATS